MNRRDMIITLTAWDTEAKRDRVYTARVNGHPSTALAEAEREAAAATGVPVQRWGLVRARAL